MNGDQAASKSKKKYVTTIVIETSYDPKEEDVGIFSLVMDATTGGKTAKVVSVNTKEDLDLNDEYEILNNKHRQGKG